MLTRAEIEAIFKETGVLQEGHFLLTSGYHSARYLQCAQVLQYPQKAELLCRSLANFFSAAEIDLVLGPATGGIILAYEMARQLGTKGIFAERTDGKMTLRRGFEIKRKERVLVVEDVVTTGGSVKEVVDLVIRHGGEAVAVAGLVDRSGGKSDFGIPAHFLLTMEVEAYPPERCPLCAQGSLPVKPGSRDLK
ncbi:MAG: orotate phosphoribosyltransferase [Dethiobacteria bacterium]|jgi:orotate phosphoribosyltransferase|nr:orotate phosphoribosyltransferase [Bacillota bacterium]